MLFASSPVFALETWTNSIGMEFVQLPSGAYLRGCNPKEGECYDNERSQRRISITPFWLGKYEVTQAQWETVMGSNPSKFKGRNNPVENVSWKDAQEFVRRLNQKERHNRYRLPSEAEWEYAARAGSRTAYSFGDDPGKLGSHAWYHVNSGDKTHPVGQKQANAWGLYDMHGNVWEWVLDALGKGNYRSGMATDQSESSASAGGLRVLRGGAWNSFASHCRSTYFDRNWPGYRSGSYGFRLALSPER